MNRIRALIFSVTCLCLLAARSAVAAPQPEAYFSPWSPAKAWEWYRQQPWLVGCNFIPSTAGNQLEMWQAETFDPGTIERELTLAQGLGLNAVRVFLHDLAYEQDPEGFLERVDRFLAIADERGIRVMFVFFDDCWNDQPKAGTQPQPRPGVHNGCWVRSPGSAAATDPNHWPRLKAYVKAVIGRYANDKRVLMWDLYNEPGNSKMGQASLPLLRAVFGWAREVGPSQPLTVGLWTEDRALNAYKLENSDVITFHDYSKPDQTRGRIEQFKRRGRPVICTEWLSRPRGSAVATHLPMFKREQIGCFQWGLVAGKTNTIWSWQSKAGDPEPKVWFHDLFRPDGTAFDAKEIETIRELTGVGK